MNKTIQYHTEQIQSLAEIVVELISEGSIDEAGFHNQDLVKHATKLQQEIEKEI